MTLAARGVDVRMGRASLLSGASLELRPGELVAVAGPNGAGKTTLLRVLAGDLRPAAGSVELEGRGLARWPAPELARRRAVMSTERSVAFGFSVMEVTLLGRLPLHGGDPGPSDRAAVIALLAEVDCANLAERPFVTLSTGERQRVQLARAIAQVSDAPPTTDDGPALSAGPSLEGPQERFLLLDEPTSNLDPAHQHRAMRLLRDEVGRGRGVLAVLHDLNLAAAYADRVVLMQGGRIVRDGPPREVLRADLLEAVFDIPMLVLPHPHRDHPLIVAEPLAARGDARPA